MKAFASGPVVNGVMTAEVVTVAAVVAVPVVASDFSGDAKSDLVFRNAATGQISAWLMNGTAIASTAGLLGADPNWRVTHIGDYNGDGKAELMWRNASDGAITMWLMNGAVTLSAAAILGASLWSVVP